MPAQQVTLLLDLVMALSVLMGGPDDEDVAVEAERLKTQFLAHTRSKASRLQVGEGGEGRGIATLEDEATHASCCLLVLQEMHVEVPPDEEEAEEIVVLGPGGSAGEVLPQPGKANRKLQYELTPAAF